MEASSMDELSDREQDNQNTNRSEACAPSTCRDSPAGNGPKETKTVDAFEELPDEGKQFQIPTIIITAAPESENELTDESTQNMTTSMDEMSVREVEMEVLLEAEKPLEATSGVDTASDDDFEVICRCSSTPMSASNDSRSSLSSPKVKITSIIEASPIKRDKEDDESENNGDTENLDNSPSVTLAPLQFRSSPGQDESFRGEGLADSQIQSEEASPQSSVSQPVPVYNVNGTKVTYVSGPASANTLVQGEGCQVQIPNGFNAGYACNSDQQISEGEKSGDITPSTQGDTEGIGQHPNPYNFVYPSIYVSNAGLISVLLRHDMSVEMTVDRTIRVVSHQHMMAVATDSRGTSACLYHPALKVIQQGTTTDIATDAVRVHMSHDDVAFAIGHSRYRFDAYDIQPATHVKFSDIFKDQSVNLLFSSEGYGESLVPHCLEVAAKAEYANLPKGGVIVRINGVKVTQTGGGDVTVVTGAKFIRLSPTFGMTRLGNRFIDIEIERDWSCRVSRGPHCFFAGDRRVIITNGKLEVEVNEHGRFKVSHLQPHRAVTPQHCLRQSDTYVRRVNSVTYTASSNARAAMAARAAPARRRSAPVTR